MALPLETMVHAIAAQLVSKAEAMKRQVLSNFVHVASSCSCCRGERKYRRAVSIKHEAYPTTCPYRTVRTGGDIGSDASFVRLQFSAGPRSDIESGEHV